MSAVGSIASGQSAFAQVLQIRDLHRSSDSQALIKLNHYPEHSGRQL